MPALADLDRRMDANPDQREAFDRNEAFAAAIAQRIPLVHVSGKGVPLDDLLTNTPHEFPTSAHPTYYTDATRRAESLLGLFASAYFYSGRACPAFGNIAIAFDHTTDPAHTVSATPFDTGGLIHERRFIRCNLNGPDDENKLIQFAQASEIQGQIWRDEFHRFLAAYFDPIERYWNGRPTYTDPEKMFSLNNDWRAWTFEIRFAEGHSVTRGCVAWVAEEGAMELLKLRQAKQPAPFPGGPESILDQFLKKSLNRIGTDSFCEELESWIQTQLGL